VAWRRSIRLAWFALGQSEQHRDLQVKRFSQSRIFRSGGGDAFKTTRNPNQNPFMSTLSIRLPNSIHQHAKRLAQTEGVSVNQLVSSALAEKLSALDAERYLNERAARGREVDINAILAKVPNTEPEPKDRIGG
jgi:hypothetical protein